jgi:hypothetical protein
MRRGHGPGSMTFGLAVQKFLNIEIFEGIGICLWCY